jgi:hypothetical protein
VRFGENRKIIRKKLRKEYEEDILLNPFMPLSTLWNAVPTGSRETKDS